MIAVRAGKSWALANWFVLCLPLLLGCSLLFARGVDWAADGAVAETVLLFDWCVSVPLLQWLCYRRTLTGKQLAVRTAAMACLGVWIVSWLVPPSAQTLLPILAPARLAGLAVLVLIELRLFVAALRIVFKTGATAQDVVEKTGAPPLIARLMVLEARFWRAVWRLLRRD